MSQYNKSDTSVELDQDFSEKQQCIIILTGLYIVTVSAVKL